MTPEEWYSNQMLYVFTDVFPPQIELDSIRNIFITYQIAEFLKYQLKIRGPYKVFIIGTSFACMENAQSIDNNHENYSYNFRDDYNVGHSGDNHTQTITNEGDVDRAVTNWINLSDFGGKTGYLRVVAPRSFAFSFAKIRGVAGRSYVELPKWIQNTCAIINIKNDDCLCLVYCV